MGTAELRNKWVKSIAKVDVRFLRMVDALYESYVQNEAEVMPEIFHKLVDQGLEDIKQGRTTPHQKVMSAIKKKYNLS